MIGDIRNACKILEKRKVGRPVHGSKANIKTYLK